MKISLNWINDYIPTKLNSDNLVEGLTDLGLECTAEVLSQSFTKVVLGKVIDCDPHPDSDHLSVCSVDTGNSELHQIVCGAPNVKKDILVPVAQIDATLGYGDFKIKKTKLRGIESHGMICSGKEINLSADHEGIMIIDKCDYPLGTPIEKIFNIKEDIIFDFDLTPNRGDCFSHRGIAREIAILEESEIKKRSLKINQTDEVINDNIDINIDVPDACFRYAARVIKNVKVGPSPQWLIDKLESIGQRSINNIVDAANFVLMDTGHPMHTFDLDKLSAKKINVRYAKPKEKIELLDVKTYELNDHHLLICDGKTPIALAGIMGGANSEIDNSTTSIVIESAFFEPTTIRKGAKVLDLFTEASKRFEREVDIEEVISSLDQLSILIAELSDGEILKGMIDEYPTKKELAVVTFNLHKCNKYLGSHLKQEAVNKIFKQLNINFKSTKDEYTCSVPVFRNDLTREVDLFEEIARVIGYNNIPSQHNFHGSYISVQNDNQSLVDSIRNHLSSNGFNEHYSNSLINEFEQSIFSDKIPVAISNPLSSEMTFLRNSIMPGLYNATKFNENRQQSIFKLFEIGMVHVENKKSPTRSIETHNLGISWYGQFDLHWRKKDRLDFYEAKGDIAHLLSKLKIKNVSSQIIDIDGFAMALNLTVKKQNIGLIGIPSEQIKKTFKIKGNMVIAELNIDALIKLNQKEVFKFQSPNPYPSISRDISIQVLNTTTSDALISTIYNNGGDLLHDVSLFDYYHDSEMGDNQKSLAFSLTFQSVSKTLKDDDIDKIMETIINQLKVQNQAIQR